MPVYALLGGVENHTKTFDFALIQVWSSGLVILKYFKRVLL